MKLKEQQFTSAIFSLVTCLGAASPFAEEIVYQDQFDNDGMETNTGIGGGAGFIDTTPQNRGPGEWTDNGNLTSTGGSWGGTSGNAYSLNGFDLRNGFKLEVTYDVVNAQTRFTIGLIEEAGAIDPLTAGFVTDGIVPHHGLIFNPVAYDSRSRYPNAPGLQFSDGVNKPEQLSNAQLNGVSGTHTVVLEMDAENNWSYSVDGADPTTGSIEGSGLDLTRDYRFFVRNQVSNRGNNIQSVTLSTIVSNSTPTITSLTEIGPDLWEATLEGAPETAYEFTSSTTLDFDPGILIEGLLQGIPIDDPGTVSDGSLLTTDSNGEGTVRMTLSGPVNFIRAQIPSPSN